MKPIFLTFFFFIFSYSAFAQIGEYEKKEFISQGDTLRYRLLHPEPGQEKYPLILFLHGAGERGNDNEKQLTHGGEMFRNPVNREKYPAYVLFPQCPPEGYWAYPTRPESFIPDRMPSAQHITPLMKLVVELLDEYLQHPDIDTGRVYLIGLSMGAMATFDLVCRYPEKFTAAIPICGTVNPSRLSVAHEVEFRIFHGDHDNIVSPEGSRRAYKTLKQAGANVEYIEFPGVNHNSWTSAFNYPDFMEWMFARKIK